MEKEGSKRVEITGLGVKRDHGRVCRDFEWRLPKTTGVHKGTTDKSHPQIRESLVEDWGITHSPNHWANGETCHR